MASLVMSLFVRRISPRTLVIQSSTRPSTTTGLRNSITSPSADFKAVEIHSRLLPFPNICDAMLSNIYKINTLYFLYFLCKFEQWNYQHKIKWTNNFAHISENADNIILCVKATESSLLHTPEKMLILKTISLKQLFLWKKINRSSSLYLDHVFLDTLWVWAAQYGEQLIIRYEKEARKGISLGIQVVIQRFLAFL